MLSEMMKWDGLGVQFQFQPGRQQQQQNSRQHTQAGSWPPAHSALDGISVTRQGARSQLPGSWLASLARWLGPGADAVGGASLLCA